MNLDKIEAIATKIMGEKGLTSIAAALDYLTLYGFPVE